MEDNYKIGDKLYRESDSCVRLEKIKEVVITKIGRKYLYSAQFKIVKETLKCKEPGCSAFQFYKTKKEIKEKIKKREKWSKIKVCIKEIMYKSIDKIPLEDLESIYLQVKKIKEYTDCENIVKDDKQ